MIKLLYLFAIFIGSFIIMTMALYIQKWVIEDIFGVWVMGRSSLGSVLHVYVYVQAGILIAYFTSWMKENIAEKGRKSMGGQR